MVIFLEMNKFKKINQKQSQYLTYWFRNIKTNNNFIFILDYIAALKIGIKPFIESCDDLNTQLHEIHQMATLKTYYK